ncbi:MAG: NAD(P)/FAD-dependent oxidoreductase [Planctomycetia bacterium]|nr:NAD(P)/FAD-dependent oxidoreductase [Planctomycetia bacterium]
MDIRQPAGLLGPDEALALTEKPGFLDLSKVTALGSGAARQLGRHGGPISLAGLRHLALDDAKHLGRHCDLLILDGLSTLDAEVAVLLGRHRGGLSLRGIRTLDPAVANGLASARGDIWLMGLRSLDVDTAAALASVSGTLVLDGLTEVTENVVAALAKHRGGLSLGGLQAMSESHARLLARHTGSLTLDAVSAMSAEAAAALAGHRGGLSLGGLSELPHDVAGALATTADDLRLDGLRSLPDDVAAALAGHRGWLSLNGLSVIEAAACRTLAGHPGWLSLMGLADVSDACALELADHARLRLPPRLLEGKRSRDGVQAAGATASREEPSFGVAIIGSGFAGIGMAIGLRNAGRQDFVIFEKAATLGGTWRDNTYPGCACDIPSYLYSYSFFPEPNWSSRYAPQQEILAYMEKVARSHGIEPFIRYRTAITALEWNEADQLWQLTAADGRQYRARAVIGAVGGIHHPQVPEIHGLRSFAGPAFHTARWRHDIDLTGRKVAVIGTGASSIQVVPEVAKVASRLIVYQRTPAWVLPRKDRRFSRLFRWAAARVPGVHRLRRFVDYWSAELRAIPLILDPRLLVHGQRTTDKFLKRCITEMQIRRKLVPRYSMGCKRILTSNDYYPALGRDHVEVVMEPIIEVRPWSVVTADGAERAVDAIVLATGFKPFNITDGMRVTGRAGASLAAAWRNGPEAFRGVAVAGFPNLFLMMGPNTALAHNSIIVMIEAQVRYIVQCLQWLADGRLDSVEVRPDVQRVYNERLVGRFERTVWSPEVESPRRGRALVPCTTWYRHPSGKNHVLWPGSSVSYCAALRHADIRDFLPKDGGSPSR